MRSPRRLAMSAEHPPPHTHTNTLSAPASCCPCFSCTTRMQVNTKAQPSLLLCPYVPPCFCRSLTTPAVLLLLLLLRLHHMLPSHAQASV
jgi:hypothetical protein